ncbi:MAG: alpha-galactosidase [Sphaerochaetaceae bacterium]|jgi:alpha-galactosidase|nr:alpha-galactosidase [Sphaerochaetaceae bacterium]NLO61067.1 alpha-galactosidase [Spirochaetales bacterium]MDD2405079.1 alpha-galactosidase [Sphaerochaetaceae bacterium]MDD3671159.1 alpha-galactosidase [Sphaerochaetaceae bacterium]MDD4258630.1 alpha-galactosidase [Sphaerochaetaceae bacterium]
MIHESNLVFSLNTVNTSYIFRVNETSHLEHLYYGRRLRTLTSAEALVDKHTISIGSSVAYDEEHPTLFLENLCLEFSSYGKGDYREPAVVIQRNNGDRVADFVYKGHRILKGKPRSFAGLAESYGDNKQCSTLVVALEDKISLLRIELYYTVFEACDVIVRKTALTNGLQEAVTIERIASSQLDLFTDDYNVVTFDGAWARERYRTVRKLDPGILVSDSKTGLSSNKHNPCIFLVKSDATENSGDCYASNLIYSGDHCETIEVTSYGKVRVLTQINPATFRWTLSSGEKFVTPEAILTFSHEGLNGASSHFHYFINEHIIRGEWKYRQRPVLVNNWEATYFNFTENRLIGLAKEAASLGAELFVLDDGWFGTRQDDTSSLGDWTINTKKLPNGLAALSKAVHQMGMMFGLWCEPEMISKKSELYRQHPDWLVAIPGRETSPGRNQYLLDLTRKEVREYLFDALSNIWNIGQVDYVKWDMNRPFSDMHSQQSDFRQEEFNHRYILGLYELLDRLTKAFPKILFESCASGGNRFDLGMLCYMPQIWTSDNTDALCRMHIQEGSSCGYPLSVMGAHVSASPNHQTLRVSSIESRFNVAAFGLLGYELDLTALNPHEKDSVRDQIAFYKLHRDLLQYGRFIRLNPIGTGSDPAIWVVSNADRSEMLVLYFQTLNTPNGKSDLLRIPTVDTDAIYAVTPRKERINLKMFGDLINRISPIRMKDGSVVDRVVTSSVALDSELEYYIVPGDLLAYAGIKLNQQFTGTGYDKETRVLGDFGSRIYHIKKIQ